ncbi:MAG: glycosyltransferase family 2 protein [Erysipelotrichaceae bacterium]|nr:glycosyltransferase family 2 protein [Erysipelotrichaceae bacterium]
MKTCIIIPAYNEEGSIKRVVDSIKEELPQCDYVVINDCSKDSTGRILDECGLNHVDLLMNLGLAGAVQTGYKYALENGYDCAIQFDGDGQHQARFIPEMIREIEKGADIVIGSRFATKKKDFSLRMIGSRILTLVLYLKTGKKIADPTSGMRMLNKKMLFDYACNMNRNPEPDTLAYQLKKGAVIKEIQVEMDERSTGVSLYSGLMSSVKYMYRMVISILFLV